LNFHAITAYIKHRVNKRYTIKVTYYLKLLTGSLTDVATIKKRATRHAFFILKQVLQQKSISWQATGNLTLASD